MHGACAHDTHLFRVHARLHLLLPRFPRLQLARTPHEDVNITDLVDRLDGYSGAELVGIFRDAAVRAVSECTSVADTPELRAAHIHAAVDAMPRQITPSMLDFYARFNGA